MRYVIVNGRVPFKPHCAYCTEEMEGGYLREIDTRLAYCSMGCFGLHCASTIVALLEDRRHEAAMR